MHNSAVSVHNSAVKYIALYGRLNENIEPNSYVAPGFWLRGIKK